MYSEARIPLNAPEAQPLAGGERDLNVADITVQEQPISSSNGFAAIGAFLLFALFLVCFIILDVDSSDDPGRAIGVAVPLGILAIICMSGLRIVSPNECFVASFFGSYRGVLRAQGCRYIMPLYSTKSVSLRLMNFESPTVKVNDLGGCPVDMRAVVVWRVVDPAQAIYHVQNLEQFVRMQTETGIRSLAAKYPYDTGLSALGESGGEVTLRNGGENVADVLRTLVQRRVRIAGVEVVEARISHLAYAQEIASSMLMRQQASAVIAARRQVVDGAVGIAKDTLARIENEITNLDPKTKSMILTNVLTTLVSEQNVQPVLALPN
jgi:regulator of protease activity HflC (stomatin/prohibitin superfamily)